MRLLLCFKASVILAMLRDKLILRKAFKALKPRGRIFIEILNRDWILKNYLKDQDTKVDSIRVVEKRDFDILMVIKTKLFFKEGSSKKTVL